MQTEPLVFIHALGKEVIVFNEGSAQQDGLSTGGLIAAIKRSPAEGDFSETTADNKPPEDQSAA